MSVKRSVTPAKAGVSGRLRAAWAAASTRPGMPAFAGMTPRLRRLSLTLGGIAGGLILLDLIGFVVTVYFHEELLAQAEAAGLGSLLQR